MYIADNACIYIYIYIYVCIIINITITLLTTIILTMIVWCKLASCNVTQKRFNTHAIT